MRTQASGVAFLQGSSFATFSMMVGTSLHLFPGLTETLIPWTLNCNNIAQVRPAHPKAGDPRMHSAHNPTESNVSLACRRCLSRLPSCSSPSPKTPGGARLGSLLAQASGARISRARLTHTPHTRPTHTHLEHFSHTPPTKDARTARPPSRSPAAACLPRATYHPHSAAHRISAPSS